MTKTFLSLFLGLAVCSSGYCQSFEEFFADKTLRADYLFTGNKKNQSVVLDELKSMEGWAGRRSNLDKLPLSGNGQLTMVDKATGVVIYRTSFSSLFQEWLGENEAETLSKGYENTFLMPFPKKETLVTVELFNARHEVSASFTHTVRPDDILIKKIGQNNVTEHKYLLKSGSPENCIDVVIMAEGYSRGDMQTFYRDAQKACDAIFSHSPFKENKNHFNVVAVASESADSGVSIPRENVWKSTAVSSHFDTFYSDRYLTSSSVNDIHDLLAGIPYEHIIILANTDTYGGGGIYNSFTLTTAHHSKFEPVVVHEFGHSFGGLADEYAYTDAPSPLYPYDVEPWEQNITTLVDFESKWSDMLPKDIVVPTKITSDNYSSTEALGVYQGAGYSMKGIYRPVPDCRMRTNEAKAFCPVCQRSLQRLIDFYTD
ncbi:IgA Peptidase M64 [uncultured Bacteroides sp.]|uniref:M64 family metallopeptidase n=1 Tax=Bacteroides TaxID=816 RepID=UPI000822BEFC|nr:MULTISPECIES: M64 family metallopeptidase [Bacteroides]MCR8892733.1 IgA Peptidase M64 [Bacteroides sp. ET336]MCU6770863.1 IgA Peptidase M64 [Bacteroides cellulolyticus]MDN0057230.1 M64 family metallopeptidase [Bacteroides caecigallinarum]SCH42437.1 IgA Peptidase M64 [uncultured Bacteroides sp.]